MDDRASDPPLHELAPTTRFSDRASDYARFRPDYPEAAIDLLLEGLGDPAALTAVDIGAGTGISARQLADRGVRVIAVEPNAAMREAAAPHPRVAWRDGTAEALGLPAGAADLALCAQSFHWFREAEALREFHRVLRSGGRLAIVWNTRDRADPFTSAFVEAIHAVHGEHPAERRPFDPAVIGARGLFEPPVRAAVAHAQRLDRAGVHGRAASASYVPKDGAGFGEMTRLLDAAFDRHAGADGTVRLRYVTEVWRSARRSRPSP